MESLIAKKVMMIENRSQFHRWLQKNRYSKSTRAKHAATMPARLLERRRCSRKRSSTNGPRKGTLLRIGWLMVALQLKNLIGGTREDARKMQSEGQTGDIAIAFDGVDALPGNARRLGKLLLGPAACRAHFFDSIADARLHVKLAFQPK